MNRAFVFGALVLVLAFSACTASPDQAPPAQPAGDQAAPGGEPNPAGAQQRFQCPDGTVVDDPADCPLDGQQPAQ